MQHFFNVLIILHVNVQILYCIEMYVNIKWKPVKDAWLRKVLNTELQLY